MFFFVIVLLIVLAVLWYLNDIIDEKFDKNILSFILILPFELLSKFLFVILKFIKFIYWILAISTLPTFIYLMAIHIPYTAKEIKIRNKRKFFKPYRKIRYETISTLFLLSLVATLALYFYFEYKSIKYNKVLLVSGVIYTITAFAYLILQIGDWRNAYKSKYSSWLKWYKWSTSKANSFTELEVEEKIRSEITMLYNNDKNKNRFCYGDIPFGRALAFISYFGRTLDEEEPLYFSPAISKVESELREYGVLITTEGIYISSSNYNYEITLNGLWHCFYNVIGDLQIDYGLSCGNPKSYSISPSELTIDTDYLCEFLKNINDICVSMYQGKIISKIDEASEILNKSSIKKAYDSFYNRNNFENSTRGIAIGGVGVGLAKNAKVYKEVKRNFDGNQGHGTAAEYANNAIDRIHGKRAIALGADDAKYGPDRNVNGVNIQCKYYETARQSINAAFEKGTGDAKYINEDGTMMKIEVPRDQYVKAIEIMKEKISNGQVPGESNPENAKNYVERGRITYLQAYNVAGSFSIDSVKIDVTQGIVCSIPGATLTTIITFASAVWNGQDIKTAAKQSAYAGLKVMGKGVGIYTLTMQFSRGKIVNPFYEVLKENGKKGANKYLKNPISAGGRGIAKKINGSGIGKKLNLKVTEKQVIGGTITTLVVFGPDICKTLSGKISGKQLFKNSIVSAVGIGGSILGNLIAPGFGGMVGGGAASFIAQKTLDIFIEDDAITMFKIFREEFLDIVLLCNFNKEEFEEIVNLTVGSKNAKKIIQNMFKSGKPKEYADYLISSHVQAILSKREKITTEMFEEGMDFKAIA